jgi:hypothetical protein
MELFVVKQLLVSPLDPPLELSGFAHHIKWPSSSVSKRYNAWLLLLFHRKRPPCPVEPSSELAMQNGDSVVSPAFG